MSIFDAVNAGDASQIKKHIAQIDSVDGDRGDTPLIVATKAGLIEMAKLLLDYGANLEATDKEGCTALYWASIYKNVKLVEYFAERGADINKRNESGATAIVSAACAGCDEAISVLLKHRANPNFYTYEARNTALGWAVTKCSHATVKALLDAGGNPTLKTTNSNTPLSLATDALVKRMFKVYQQPGGPPWLVRELSARGLEWSAVCDAEDRLAKEGCATRESLLRLPLSQFTHCYLERIGVEALFVRQAVLDLRLQCTWLGTRLADHGVSNSALAACEFAVFHTIGCSTEASFAQVLPDELCDMYLMRMRIESGFVRRCLRAVHGQVHAEHNMPPVTTSTTTSAATSTTTASTTSTSTAEVVLPCPVAQGTTDALQMSDAGPLQRRADAPPPQEVGNWEHL